MTIYPVINVSSITQVSHSLLLLGLDRVMWLRLQPLGIVAPKRLARLQRDHFGSHNTMWVLRNLLLVVTLFTFANLE